MSLTDDVELAELLKLLDAKKPPETMEELNELMARISNVIVKRMIEFGVPTELAIEMVHLTVAQAGLYYNIRRELDE